MDTGQCGRDSWSEWFIGNETFFRTILAEHLERLSRFYGQKSIEDYIGWVLPELNFFDPNAFMVIEFEPFDSNIEKAKLMLAQKVN